MSSSKELIPWGISLILFASIPVEDAFSKKYVPHNIIHYKVCKVPIFLTVGASPINYSGNISCSQIRVSFRDPLHRVSSSLLRETFQEICRNGTRQLPQSCGQLRRHQQSLQPVRDSQEAGLQACWVVSRPPPPRSGHHPFSAWGTGGCPDQQL